MSRHIVLADSRLQEATTDRYILDVEVGVGVGVEVEVDPRGEGSIGSKLLPAKSIASTQ